MYKNLLKEYKDDNLADVYWNLLLCEQRVMFERDEKGEQFPSFYDIVPTEIEKSENYHKTIEYLNRFSPQNIGSYIELVDKMYTTKRKYQTIKNTSKPYDIFICFKKSKLDSEGVTDEYKLAFDLYNILSKDYNVFFSERSLNNIVVREYEPNIYHALYTAKIMLVLCSKREYLESQWVRNEWSRFKAMSSTTSQAKSIIPIFMDGFQENTLPDEIRTCQGIRADYSLTESLKSAIKVILNPVDKQAELAAQIETLAARIANMQSDANSNTNAHSESNTEFNDKSIDNLNDSSNDYYDENYSTSELEYSEKSEVIGDSSEVSKIAENQAEVNIDYTAGTDKSRKIKRRNFWLQFAAWAVAIVVLIVALVYYNALAPTNNVNVSGKGDRAPDFTVSTFESAATRNEDGTYMQSFSSLDHKGKVMVVNFWYTACDPCVEELPEFAKIKDEFGDDIIMIAMHAEGFASARRIVEFINSDDPIHNKTSWAEWGIIFANGTDEIFTAFGGKSAYPITAIVDKDGFIAFFKDGKLDGDTLRAEIKKLL